MYLSLIFVDWLRTWMWGTPCLLSWVLGYSRKIPKKGWVEYIYTFLKKPLWIYIFVTLSLENKLSPLEIPKNLRPMERPMENPYNFFLITPRKSTSFLIDSGISTCFFHVLTHVTCLAWIFSGIAKCSWYVFTLHWVAILCKWPQSCFPHLRLVQKYSKQQILRG